MGLIAGPLRPAVTFDIRGLRVSALIAIPMKVLIKEMASAPASSADRAIKGTLATLGESFTMSGRDEAALQLATRSASTARSAPNMIPPCLVLGQETLSS